MNSKEVKIKRITPEEVITPEIKRPDYDYWYKDRPLNAKRWIYNNILPYFWFYDTLSIPNNAETLVQSSPFAPSIIQKSPNQDWFYYSLPSHWTIKIPQNWIYLFNVDIEWGSWTYWAWTTWGNVIELYSWQRFIDYKYMPSWTFVMHHKHTIILDLLANEAVQFKAYQNTGWAKTASLYVYMVKLWDI